MSRGYITYALLDPEYPNTFTYGNYSFDYKPIYIGAGQPCRVDAHGYRIDLWSRNNVKGWSYRPLYKRLIELRDHGMEEVKVVLSRFNSIEDAYKEERIAINTIGMSLKSAGPLLNSRAGYRRLGPFIVISPEGECHYVGKSKLSEFCREYNTSRRTLIRSADRFDNHHELRKGYRKHLTGYGWSCVHVSSLPIDSGSITDDTDLHSLLNEMMHDMGIDFDEFIESKPVSPFSCKRLQKAATKGRLNSHARKFGFKSNNDAVIRIQYKHSLGYSLEDIMSEYQCTESFAWSRLNSTVDE